MKRASASRAVQLQRFLVVPCALLLGAAACGSNTSEESALDRGRALFHSTELSRSTLNDNSCATCHDAAEPEGSIKPGASMASVTRRTSFWGGQEIDLLRSINQCRSHFMLDNLPLEAADESARALYVYLDSLDSGDAQPVAFSVVKDLDPRLPRGDAQRGGPLYTAACASCHGSMHSGKGRLSARIPKLPEDTIAEHADYSLRDQRLVFLEKIRHGGFYGYGGDMPPFSLEALSDTDVSDLLEALGMIGE